jgi:hypothetical protein
MNQALYAHMNNKRKRLKKKKEIILKNKKSLNTNKNYCDYFYWG